MVTAIVILLGVAYATTQIDGAASAGDDDSSPSPSGGKVPALLALSVTGAPKPLLAVVGAAGSPPAAMGVPQGLTLEVPGAGPLTTRQVASLPGDGLQVALSNVVGAWAAHHAVTDLEHLAVVVDREDGLPLELPEEVTLGTDVLGPGDVRMTGAQVAQYLGEENQNTFTRWEVVLAGLLAAPPQLEPNDLTETDDVTKESSTRAGKVMFQRLPEDDARIRVTFETRESADGPAKQDKIEYLLEKGWLTERNYRRKDNVRRQVLKPGEKINLLKLGEGPFPLPIGQAKEDVKQMFEVEIVPAASDDPAGTVHGRLTPKPKTQFERKFKSIDVWVDPKAQMPRRIQTLDRSASTVQTTDLENVKSNTGLKDDDFKLDEVKAKDGWKLRDEPYEE